MLSPCDAVRLDRLDFDVEELDAEMRGIDGGLPLRLAKVAAKVMSKTLRQELLPMLRCLLALCCGACMRTC